MYLVETGVFEGLEGGLAVLPCPILGNTICKPPAEQEHTHTSEDTLTIT